MKNLLIIICLFSIGFIFSGCPYNSSVPIDAPSVKINTQLLGTWEDESKDTYIVSKADEFTYSIEQKNEKYLAYTSIVKGITFLNILEVSHNDSTSNYAFYRMDINPDGSITLAEVTENIDEKFSSSKELKDFFTANLKNSYFYGKDEIKLTRPGK